MAEREHRLYQTQKDHIEDVSCFETAASKLTSLTFSTSYTLMPPLNQPHINQNRNSLILNPLRTFNQQPTRLPRLIKRYWIPTFDRLCLHRHFVESLLFWWCRNRLENIVPVLGIVESSSMPYEFLREEVLVFLRVVVFCWLVVHACDNIAGDMVLDAATWTLCVCLDEEDGMVSR